MKVVLFDLFELHFFFTRNEMFVRDLCFVMYFDMTSVEMGLGSFIRMLFVAFWFWLVSLLCVLFLIEEKWRRSLFTKRDVFP